MENRIPKTKEECYPKETDYELDEWDCDNM